MSDLTFVKFQETNSIRCVKGFKSGIDDWNPMEWACALAGEVGELAGEVVQVVDLIVVRHRAGHGFDVGDARDAARRLHLRVLETVAHVEVEHAEVALADDLAAVVSLRPIAAADEDGAQGRQRDETEEVHIHGLHLLSKRPVQG